MSGAPRLPWWQRRQRAKALRKWPCDRLCCRDGGMAWVEANWKYLCASGGSDA